MNSPPVRAPFWRRRIVEPLRRQLTQGVAPDRLAFTLGLGTACSLFPFLGFTSLLNLGAGLALGLNQPVLQTLNQLLTPVQLGMIFVYIRTGEWLWRAQDDRFTLAEMLQTFRDASLGEFLQRFGWAGLHAFTAWAITAPLLVAGLTWLLRPVFRRMASAAGVRP